MADCGPRAFPGLRSKASLKRLRPASPLEPPPDSPGRQRPGLIEAKQRPVQRTRTYCSISRFRRPTDGPPKHSPQAFPPTVGGLVADDRRRKRTDSLRTTVKTHDPHDRITPCLPRQGGDQRRVKDAATAPRHWLGWYRHTCEGGARRRRLFHEARTTPSQAPSPDDEDPFLVLWHAPTSLLDRRALRRASALKPPPGGLRVKNRSPGSSRRSSIR